jgi:hypothetical protein
LPVWKGLKGDTTAIILEFPALFLSIEFENVWPSAMANFAVLHVVKDAHVRRPGHPESIIFCKNT